MHNVQILYLVSGDPKACHYVCKASTSPTGRNLEEIGLAFVVSINKIGKRLLIDLESTDECLWAYHPTTFTKVPICEGGLW